MPSITFAPANNVNVNGSVRSFQLPIKYVCMPNAYDGLIVEEDYNCSRECKQSGRQYFIPILDGDTLHLQTLFFDGTRDAVLDYDSVVDLEGINPDATTFAVTTLEKMSAFQGSRPYQIVSVDVSAMPDCFQIKLTRISTGDELFTQWFTKTDCKDTIVISSDHSPNRDTLGNYYGEPDDGYVGDLIQYDNSIRVHADVRWNSATEQREEISNRITDFEIRDIYGFRTLKKIPPFMKNIIVRQMIGVVPSINEDASFTIDGETYYIDSVNVSDSKEFGGMHRLEFDIYKPFESISRKENILNCG